MLSLLASSVNHPLIESPCELTVHHHLYFGHIDSFRVANRYLITSWVQWFRYRLKQWRCIEKACTQQLLLIPLQITPVKAVYGIYGQVPDANRYGLMHWHWITIKFEFINWRIIHIIIVCRPWARRAYPITGQLFN